MTDTPKYLTAPERHADKIRNLILNHALTDLEEIINSHDPDIDAPINRGIWDRLYKMAMLIEAKEAATLHTLSAGIDQCLVREHDANVKAFEHLRRAEAAEARERALLASNNDTRCVLVENTSLRTRLKAAEADLTDIARKGSRALTALEARVKELEEANAALRAANDMLLRAVTGGDNG